MSHRIAGHSFFDGHSTLLSGPVTNGRYRIMGSQNSPNFIGASHFNTAGSFQLRLDAPGPWSGVASDTVTIHVVESIPYDDWASGTFTNPFTATGLTGNPDGDQLINLQEYAFGLTYSVEFSADFALWAVAGTSPTRQISVTDTGDYEAASVPYPSQVPVSGGGASSEVFPRRCPE